MSFLPSYIVIHHSATSADATLDDIRRAHIARGMSEIAYHFLIDRRGNVLVGRDLGLPGEHARGINSESIGICCIGDFSKIPPRPVVVEALIDIIAKLRAQFSIPAQNVIGHSQVFSLKSDATETICPGPELLGLIGYIRERSQNAHQSTLVESWQNVHVYDFKELHISRSWMDEWTLTLEIQIKNTGTIDWDLRNPTTPNVEAKLYATREGEAWISVDLNLVSKLIPAGQIGTARAWLDLSQFGPGAIRLKYSVNFPGSGLAPRTVELDGVRAPRSGGSVDTRYRCEIPELHIQQSHDFLLVVYGRVKNTGSSAWINKSRHEGNPFRLGLLTYVTAAEKSSEILEEYRYEMPGSTVLTGEEFSFQFEINSLRLPAGEVELIVSMVRENEFWFHQRGSIAATKKINIAPRKELPKSIEVGQYHLAPSANTSKLLFIAPGLPLFDRDTGGRRLLEVIKTLRNFGTNITFVYENDAIFASSHRYHDQLDDLGVSVHKGPLALLARTGAHDFTACILCWYSCAARYIDVVRKVLPACKIIVDSVDVHWLREQRGVMSGEVSLSADVVAANKTSEIAVYRSSDEVWTVSEEDRQAVLAEIPMCNLKVIPLMTDVRPALFCQDARDIIFVGNFNHPPNLSAVIWGYHLVREFRQRSGFEGRFYIIGDNPPKEVRDLDDGNLTIVTGYVEDLNEYYQRARLLLAPIKYGAGVKGKITDAAAFAIPIVTTPIGNEGIGFQHGSEAWICESSGEFIDALQQAFATHTDIQSIGFAGRRRVLRSSGKAAANNSIICAIAAMPVVISIVTYNQRELLKRCLNSLLEETEYPNWRIALVSNGCTDGTRELVSQLQTQFPRKIDFYTNQENKFFVEPNNQVISRYSDCDAVLLNNDTEVIDGRWLYELNAAAYSTAMGGASGCLILDSSGVVSEAGARIMQNGSGVNFARGLTRLSPEVTRFRYVGFVSGCCLYMRRDMIERYGMLDPEFSPMYYEDVEWQYRLHSFGIKTIWTPRACIQHTEGSSAGTDTSIGLKRFQDINRAKFMQKYAGLDLDYLSN